MARVHPNASPAISSRWPRNEAPPSPPDGAGGKAVAMTVWRKSLLFNCGGFTVFDAKGDLVFRVDNYPSSHRAEVVLMDAVGNPLLTVRRKKLSLGENWLVYNGEEATGPLFSAKKHVGFLRSKALLAHVATRSAAAAGGRRTYGVEGSYSRRCCAVYDEQGKQLVEIKRKEAVGGVGFGGDVFRLVVQPGFAADVAMAIVILLDQMFSFRPGSLVGG